jgi:hypothetical protein
LTIDELIEQIRQHISDYKYAEATVVDESPAEGKLTAHAATNYWNSFSTGKDHEEFLTKGMPLVSGSKVLMRGGRWAYSNWGTYPDNYDDNWGSERVFLVDWYRGTLVVPSGAVPIVSGEKVKLTYSWWEDREYRFSDLEVKTWINDGDSMIRQRLSLPYTITGRGADLAFDTVPEGIYFSLLALASSYFIRRRLEEEGFQDGIFVKDGDTAFDTTKTLVHRGRSLRDVKADVEAIIMDIKMGELAEAGIKLDTYSTRDRAWPGGVGSDQETNTLGYAPFIDDGGF